MTILSAALVGSGLLLMYSALVATERLHPTHRVRRLRWYRDTGDRLRSVGWHSISVPQFLAISATLALVMALVGAVVTTVPALGILAGAIGSAAPTLYLRARARSMLQARREAWPDAVDHIASAVRAGLSIPEALRQLAEHGPEVLRPDFRAFSRHDAAHGRFDESLDVLKASLADPAADRLIESLRLARNVGGTDVGRLLRTLSAFLREDNSTRAELTARQSWTVSAAKLALAAPWIALLLVGFRSDGFAAYRTGTGVMILIFGSLVSGVAYAAMRAIGRLPLEERVMR